MKYKLCFLFCILFILCLCIPITLAENNLLGNNGFEEVDGAGKPTGGWVLNGMQGVQGVSLIGNRSVFASLEEGASGIRVDQMVYNIVGGKKYYTSVWVCSNLEAEVYFKTEWYNSQGKFCGGVDSPHFFTAGNDKWQKLSWEHEAPIEASDKVRVLFRTKGPGDVWFDEAYFGDEPELVLKRISDELLSISEIDQNLDLTLLLTPFSDIELSKLVAEVREQSTEKVVMRQILAQGLSEGIHQFQLNTSGIIAGEYSVYLSVLDSLEVIRGEESLRLEVKPVLENKLNATYLFNDEKQAEVLCKLISDIPDRELYSIRVKIVEEDGAIIVERIARSIVVGYNKFFFDISNIDIGTYKVVIEFYRTNELISSEEFKLTIMQREDLAKEINATVDIRSVSIGPNNEILVNEKPFIMKALYHVPTEAYSLVRAQGFNTVQIHPNRLEEAHRNGLYGLVNLYPNMRIELDYIRETVLGYRNHPAVLMWLLLDEPDYNNESPENMKEAYELIKELDPNHPVTFVLTRPNDFSRYVDALDILATNPYPIPKKPVTNVSQQVEMAIQAVDGKKPIFTILQAFGGYSGWEREPTEAESRVMLYLSIIKGSTAFGWYSLDDRNKFSWWLPDSVELWSSFKRTNQELKHLKPVIYAKHSSRALNILSLDEGEVEFCFKEDDLWLYIIVANTKMTPTRIKVEIDGLENTSKCSEITYATKFEIQDGTFEDTLEGFGAHVYKIQKSVPATDKEQRLEVIPQLYNPINGECNIFFASTKEWFLKVECDIINSAGRLVRTIKGSPIGDNRFLMEWDAKDQSGKNVANGLYIIRVKGSIVGQDGKYFNETQKVIVAR